MLLKNGKAAEKMNTRTAAITQISRIRTFSFQLANVLNSPEMFTISNVNKSGGRVRPPLTTLFAGSHPLQLYEDLYLTEQPYGLVCGVVTDLPANDSSNAALT